MNRLRAYVRRTMLNAAREYAYPAKRRTRESTQRAFYDALQGTETGWWTDLIYVAPMLKMARRYRRDIVAALAEVEDATGTPFIHRDHGMFPVSGASIVAALYRSRPYGLDDYRSGTGDGPNAVLLGLRLAVEWYATEVAREFFPDKF